MKYKNEWFLCVFFCGMFLLQIWVAQAQNNNNKLTDYSAATLQAAYKITHDPQLIGQLGLQARDATKNQENSKRESRRSQKIEKKINFVWYNPWSWFN